jgi:GTPase Era involved in 16S rRNA processing
MKWNRHPSALRALGQIEGCLNELSRLQDRLEKVTLWSPAVALKKQCGRAVQMIRDIAARFDRKLVVSIVGPSGSGKSTLMNALVGIDDLSRVGHQRPTTRRILVFGQDSRAAETLANDWGAEATVIRASRTSDFSNNLILVDTPDTDSRALERHAPLLRRAIGGSDMLICVFDAENPKRKDHADFLLPYVQRFDGESLVVVLNKCDRLAEEELKQSIFPDFEAYLRSAWPGMVDTVLCASARRHLQNPAWDSSAAPRHAHDQFESLKRIIQDNTRHGSYVVDRRVENARHLRQIVLDEVRRELAADSAGLREADQRLRALERQAAEEAVDAMQSAETRKFLGTDILLYQKLSQMWLGPVGWMIAVWARLLIFGAGLVALFRFGRPVHQLVGVLSALRHHRDAGRDVSDSRDGRYIDRAMARYRRVVMEKWPDIAALLKRGRFDARVGEIPLYPREEEELGTRLALLWSDTLETEIERRARMLSRLVWQFIFNAPGLAILGYAGWLTVTRFLSGAYLTGHFFLHAFWAVLITLLLSFFLLQIAIRLTAKGERIQRHCFERLRQEMRPFQLPFQNPVRDQIETLLELATVSDAGSPERPDE